MNIMWLYLHPNYIILSINVPTGEEIRGIDRFLQITFFYILK